MLNKGLTLAIENKSISHAYIFYDEDTAFEFASKLNVLPADFIVQEELLTKPIEELQANLKIKPFGDLRLVLIKNADNMQIPVQNKMLKTLEEPLGNTVIILTATRRDAFLPTILSRCVEIAGADKELETADDTIDLAKRFITAKTFFERKALVDGIDDKEYAISFLNAIENELREDLIKSLDSKRLSKSIKLVEDTRKSIASGFSLGFSLKALALDM